MTDEKPPPTRTDQARQIAEEYASDLREIIKKLSRFSPRSALFNIDQNARY